MPYTPEQKAHFDLQCYGMPEADVREDLTKQMELSGKNMLIMSMLSDAQHLIEVGAKESARQLINRAKWALTELEPNAMDKYIEERRKEARV